MKGSTKMANVSIKFKKKTRENRFEVIKTNPVKIKLKIHGLVQPNSSTRLKGNKIKITIPYITENFHT